MKRLKIFLWHSLVLVLLVTSAGTMGQSNKSTPLSVKGIVVISADNIGLPATTIVIKSESGEILSTVASDRDGSFSIAVRSVTKISIKISYLGYVDYNSGLINLKNEDLDLGRISLEEKSNTMQGITIVGSKRKPLIQNGKDKITYNAASDISNKSGNAADVLRKAPMLTVGANGELKMRGNSNIKVLINGVASGIMAKNLKEALKMIPASAIVSVEVMVNPSAKYEAEGAAGVVNIITRKKLKGTSGTLDLTGGNLERTGNLALNIATGKFNISALGSYNDEREKTNTEMQRIALMDGKQTGNLFQKSDGTQTTRGGSAGLTVQYQIDSLQTLEGSFSYWNGSWPQKSSFYNRYQNNSGTEEYRQKIQQNGKFNYKEWVLNYQKKFEREGQELQLIAQTSSSSDLSDYLTEQYKTDGTLSFREKGPNKGAEKDWSIQTDYAQPLLSASGKVVFETGLGLLGNTSDSFYDVTNTHLPIDPLRSGNMSYSQNVFSAYAILNAETVSGWTFRPGIRFENTMVNAAFQSGSPFRRTFSNWATNLLIAKKLGEKHELKWSYTERIRRPGIFDLNPYSNASDPLNITQGNPYLKPELTRNLELSHIFTSPGGTTLMSSLYYRFNKNSIEQVIKVNSNGVAYTTPGNIGENNRLGANVNAAFNPVKNWTLNTGVEVFHLRFRSRSLGLTNNGVFFNTSLNNTFILPKNLTISASGDYGNGFITLQGKSSANYSYRFAIRKQFLADKASFTMAVVNPFQKTYRENVYTFAPTFQSTATNRFSNRAATLTFSWQFGGLKSGREKETRFSNESNGKPPRGRKIK